MDSSRKEAKDALLGTKQLLSLSNLVHRRAVAQKSQRAGVGLAARSRTANHSCGVQFQETYTLQTSAIVTSHD